MIKRVFFLICTNLAIILTISLIIAIVENVFGIAITPRGDMVSLFIFALLFGFGGAFINLQLSRWMAKRMYGIELINRHHHDPKLSEVYEIVKDLAQRHHIHMPEVGVYESHEPNAFATGASKNRSLVAVSTGLLDQMNSSEIKGVIGHEMAHIFNGDMVTMTLMQGVLNTFVIFLARILATVVQSALTKDEDEGGGWAYFLIVMFLEMILGVLASLILMAYSRSREFVADADSAKMLGKEHMIHALEKLKSLTQRGVEFTKDEFATMKIAGAQTNIFATHPSLDDRIEALKQLM